MRSSIRRLAGLLRLAVYAIMGVVVLSQLAYAFGPLLPLVELQVRDEYPGLPMVVQIVLRLVAVTAWLASFWCLALAMRPLERGELFTAELTVNLRRFAGLLAVALAVPALLGPCLSFLLHDCPSRDTCSRALRIDMREIILLLVATLFFFFAKLLDEARLVELDNQQII